MPQPHAGEPRDPARPADYYRQVVAAEREAIDHILSYGNPGLFLQLPPRFLRLASALYSAGAPPEEVLGPLGDAADYEERYLREAKRYEDDAYRDMEEYLDIFGAALLSGRGGPLVAAFRRTKFDAEPAASDALVMRQLCALVVGEPFEPAKGDDAAARKLGKGWKSVPPLLTAAAAGSDDFAPALTEYLTTLWGPATERWAKSALRSDEPEYWGKWSIFSGALCHVAGTVPELPAKARQYVPADLVGVVHRS